MKMKNSRLCIPRMFTFKKVNLQKNLAKNLKLKENKFDNSTTHSTTS